MTRFWKTTNARPRSFAAACAFAEVTCPVTLTVVASSCSNPSAAEVRTLGRRLTFVTVIVLEVVLSASSQALKVIVWVLPFFHSREGQKNSICACPSPSERENLPSA